MRLTLTDQADDDLRGRIVAPLKAYNERQAGPSGHRPLVVALCDDAGEVLGGLWGATSYGWLFTQLLAVPDDLRGAGWGNRLMDLAESEAVSRGCHAAWLDTFEFQALAFYEKRGYVRFGELPDCPVGFRRFFLKKVLRTA